MLWKKIQEKLNLAKGCLDFHEACNNGNIERVLELLLLAGKEGAQTMLLQRGEATRTGLHMACMGRQRDIVFLLLGHEVEIHFHRFGPQYVAALLTSAGLLPPVHWETQIESETCCPTAKIALPSWAVVQSNDLISTKRYIDRYGNTPLLYNACYGRGATKEHDRHAIEIARALIQHGDAINATKLSTKWSVLHWASFYGNPVMVRLLLHPEEQVNNTRNSTNAPISIVGVICTQKSADHYLPIDLVGQQGLLQDVSDRTPYIKVIKLLVQEYLLDKANVSKVAAKYQVYYLKKGFNSTRHNFSREKLASRLQTYGNHLLYWSSAFNLTTEVGNLLLRNLEAFASIRVGHLVRQSSVHVAAMSGHYMVLQLLLDSVPILLNNYIPGWQNSVNDTPLHVAAIASNKKCIDAILAFIQAHNLSLKECNIEGWTAYDYGTPAVKDSIRTLLGCKKGEPKEALFKSPTNHYDFVFVFQRKNYLFRNSVTQTFREESSQAPTLIADMLTGKRFPNYKLKGPDYAKQHSSDCTEQCCIDCLDYVLVTCTGNVMRQHAEKLRMKVRSRGTHKRHFYKVASRASFVPFSSSQCHEILYDIILQNINLDRRLAIGDIDMVFPLHESNGMRLVKNGWLKNKKNPFVTLPFGKKIVEFLSNDEESSYEPLGHVFNYCGIKRAIYFAWMQHYIVWLVFITIPGVATQIAHAAYGTTSLLSLYAVVVCIWTTFVVECWKRKRSELLCKWDVDYNMENHTVNPRYRGDFEIDPVTKQVQTSSPKFMQLFRQGISMSAFATMATIVAACFTGIQTMDPAIKSDKDLWIPQRFRTYVIPAANAVTISLLNLMYRKIAYQLALWENHRTVGKFEAVLTEKMFWFQFINSFIALFWFAFVEVDSDVLNKQLIAILVTRQIVDNLRAYVIPKLYVQFRLAKHGLRHRDADRPLLSKNGQVAPGGAGFDHKEENVLLRQIQCQQLMLDGESHIEDQIQAMIQFGYVTMFVTSFPAAPLFALVNNVLQNRLEIANILFVRKRSLKSDEGDVGSFQSMLEFMSFAAVVVNCAMFFRTNNYIDDILFPGGVTGDTNLSAKLWVALLVEHVILGLKALLVHIINDSPAWVRNYHAQTSYLIANKSFAYDSQRGSIMQVPKHSPIKQIPTGDISIANQNDQDSKSESICEKLDSFFDEITTHANTSSSRNSSENETTMRSILQEYHGLENEFKILRDDLRAHKLQNKLLIKQLATSQKQSSSFQEMRDCAICFAFRADITKATVRCTDCKLALCEPCNTIAHITATFHIRVPMRSESQDKNIHLQNRLGKLSRHLSSDAADIRIMDDATFADNLKKNLINLIKEKNKEGIRNADDIIDHFYGHDASILLEYLKHY